MKKMKCPYCASTNTIKIEKVGEIVIRYPMGHCNDCDSGWIIGGRRHKKTKQRGGAGKEV